MRTVYLGMAEYQTVFEAMKSFTEHRTPDTPDELWVVEHPPVFTQGMAGKPEHLLKSTSIPVIQVDRGGQITYHGPGQLVIYTLIHFQRKNISVRKLVSQIEQSIIDCLAYWKIAAYSDPDRPGVYINHQKIASLGLRIKNGSVYHGLSLNVNMDLTPFSYINPCGYSDMQMTHMAEHITPTPTINEVANKLIHFLTQHLDKKD